MAEKSKVQEELEQLQLQEMREVAEAREQQRRSRTARRAAVEAGFKRDRASQERIQAACWHRKGGKGTAQLYQGNDTNYATITHTLSHGVTIVVCQRCGHVWRPPEKLRKGASAEEKAAYRQQADAYRTALNYPTDNEPSGTQIFILEEETAYA